LVDRGKKGGTAGQLRSAAHRTAPARWVSPARSGTCVGSVRL